MGYSAPAFNSAAPSWRDDLSTLFDDVVCNVADALKQRKPRTSVWLGYDQENTPEFRRKLVEAVTMLPGVEKAAYVVKEFPMSQFPDVGYLQIDLKQPRPAASPSIRRRLQSLFRR